MDNTKLEEKINKLTKDLTDLTNEVYSNNFSASQDFQKYSRFNTRLKIPHYDTVPSIGEIGEIIEVDGKLRICNIANTFVIVGGQS